MVVNKFPKIKILNTEPTKLTTKQSTNQRAKSKLPDLKNLEDSDSLSISISSDSLSNSLSLPRNQQNNEQLSQQEITIEPQETS